MLRPFANPVACCCVFFFLGGGGGGVVAQSLKPVNRLSQQLPTFRLFRDHRSVAQQYCICSHSPCNIVGATHAHYTWFPHSHGLYPSHNARHVSTLLEVIASVCT